MSRQTGRGTRTSRFDKNQTSEKQKARKHRRKEMAVTHTPEEIETRSWLRPHRFQPGHTPVIKIKKPLSDRYAEALECVVPEPERKRLGLPPGSTMADAIAWRMAIRGIEGKAPVAATREMREAVEGKAVQPVDVTMIQDLPDKLRRARERLQA